MRKVTAAVIFAEDKILIAKRAQGDHLAGQWELPGGKIEAGETPQECLKRELREELGIEVEVKEYLGESRYEYESGAIELIAHRVLWMGGEMHPIVHDEIAWVRVGQLMNYDFAPADIPLIERLFGDEDGI